MVRRRFRARFGTIKQLPGYGQRSQAKPIRTFSNYIERMQPELGPEFEQLEKTLFGTSEKNAKGEGAHQK